MLDMMLLFEFNLGYLIPLLSEGVGWVSCDSLMGGVSLIDRSSKFQTKKPQTKIHIIASIIVNIL